MDHFQAFDAIAFFILDKDLPPRPLTFLQIKQKVQLQADTGLHSEADVRLFKDSIESYFLKPRGWNRQKPNDQLRNFASLSEVAATNYVVTV